MNKVNNKISKGMNKYDDTIFLAKSKNIKATKKPNLLNTNSKKFLKVLR